MEEIVPHSECVCHTCEVWAVMASNAESGSPNWRWYAAKTEERLLKEVGHLERLEEPKEKCIYRVWGGSWLIINSRGEWKEVHVFE